MGRLLFVVGASALLFMLLCAARHVFCALAPPRTAASLSHGRATLWRAGAALYRPFAARALGPPWAPEYVREMPTAQCWLAHHGSDGDVGKLFEVQQQAPIHASYLMKSLNTSTPEGWRPQPSACRSAILPNSLWAGGRAAKITGPPSHGGCSRG